MLRVSQLALPLECRAAVNSLVNQALDNISSVDIDGTQSDQLLALVGCQLAVDDGDQVCQLSYLLLVLYLRICA